MYALCFVQPVVIHSLSAVHVHILLVEHAMLLWLRKPHKTASLTSFSIALICCATGMSERRF